MLAVKHDSRVFIENVFDDINMSSSKQIKNFRWLYYYSEGKNFPECLQMIGVFATIHDLMKSLKDGTVDSVCQNAQESLLKEGIIFNDIREHISFDTDDS